MDVQYFYSRLQQRNHSFNEKSPYKNSTNELVQAVLKTKDEHHSSKYI